MKKVVEYIPTYKIEFDIEEYIRSNNLSSRFNLAHAYYMEIEKETNKILNLLKDIPNNESFIKLCEIVANAENPNIYTDNFLSKAFEIEFGKLIEDEEEMKKQTLNASEDFKNCYELFNMKLCLDYMKAGLKEFFKQHDEMFHTDQFEGKKMCYAISYENYMLNKSFYDEGKNKMTIVLKIKFT
jgi:hypothetical protein